MAPAMWNSGTLRRVFSCGPCGVRRRHRVGHVDREVQIGQQHPLRHRGGAGGEDHDRGVFVVRLHVDGGVVAARHEVGVVEHPIDLALQRDDVLDAGDVGPDLGSQLDVAIRDEERLRLRGAEHVRQLFGPGAIVHGHQRDAEPRAGVVDEDVFDRVHRQHGDVVAPAQSQPLQGVGEPRDLLRHLRVRALLLFADQRDPVRQHRSADVQEFDRVHLAPSSAVRLLLYGLALALSSPEPRRAARRRRTATASCAMAWATGKSAPWRIDRFTKRTPAGSASASRPARARTVGSSWALGTT